MAAISLRLLTIATMSHLPPFSGSDRRPALSGPEQHEFLQQQLGRNRISRRNIIKGSVGAVGAAFLLGNSSGSQAFADQLTSTGTIADGFVVISVVVPGNQKAETGPYVSQRDFTDRYETIDWSQARLRDYAFIALDVVPAAHGGTTTMTLRAID